jgi:AcrR family transcriptional regulator
VRTIAAAAGVSEALVFHHFGSKDGLRTACDEYVLHVLVERARAARNITKGQYDLLGVYLSNPDEYVLYVQYVVRAIEDDAPATATFVDTMVEESEAIFRAGAADGSMRPSSDVRALAVFNALVSLAVLTMPPALARALGYERFGPDMLQRMTVPILELYTNGLYTDDTLSKGSEDAWADAHPPQQKED